MNSSTNATYYGLSTSKTDTDPHLMKNSEWGAVAYLEYSQYGRNGVQPNFNSFWYAYGTGNYAYTGYASSATTGAQQTTTTVANISADNKYNGQYGILGSTTGNVTGVYDMSGGLNEYTAAYASGASTSTGLTMITSGNSCTKYVTFYENKTLYSSTTVGDALTETDTWDNNGDVKLSSSNLFIMRGGATSNGSGTLVAGVFSSYAANGGSTAESSNGRFRGFRPVLVTK